MSVIEEIEYERRRQVEGEGFTPEHDDWHHTGGELALAAASYAVHSAFGESTLIPPIWPWSGGWWKPKTRRRDLIRAAALLVAEIERLDRAERRSG